MKYPAGTRVAYLVAVLALALAGGCPGEQAPSPPAKPQSQPGRTPEAKEKAEAVDPALVERGKVEFRNCGTCHCETDPKIEWDEDWVNLNIETTCIGGGAPEPEVRKSIMSYLRHPDTLRPMLVDKHYKPAQGVKTGKIFVPATGGSAYLKATRDSIKGGSPAMVRLYWEETQQEKPMTSPAGEYTVINYWLYRRTGTEMNERWSVSVTNVDGCADLLIAEGVDCWLTTDPLLRVSFTAERTETGVALKFELYDIGGNRASLTRNGHMIFPKYEIIDANGNILGGARFSVI